MLSCPYCKREVSPEFTFCPYCAQRIQSSTSQGQERTGCWICDAVLGLCQLVNKHRSKNKSSSARESVTAWDSSHGKFSIYHLGLGLELKFSHLYGAST